MYVNKIVNRKVNEVLRNTKAGTITAKQPLGMPNLAVLCAQNAFRRSFNE